MLDVCHAPNDFVFILARRCMSEHQNMTYLIRWGQTNRTNVKLFGVLQRTAHKNHSTFLIIETCQWILVFGVINTSMLGPLFSFLSHRYFYTRSHTHTCTYQSMPQKYLRCDDGLIENADFYWCSIVHRIPPVADFQCLQFNKVRNHMQKILLGNRRNSEFQRVRTSWCACIKFCLVIRHWLWMHERKYHCY